MISYGAIMVRWIAVAILTNGLLILCPLPRDFDEKDVEYDMDEVDLMMGHPDVKTTDAKTWFDEAKAFYTYFARTYYNPGTITEFDIELILYNQLNKLRIAAGLALFNPDPIAKVSDGKGLKQSPQADAPLAIKTLPIDATTRENHVTYLAELDEAVIGKLYDANWPCRAAKWYRKYLYDNELIYDKTEVSGMVDYVVTTAFGRLNKMEEKRKEHAAAHNTLGQPILTDQQLIGLLKLRGDTKPEIEAKMKDRGKPVVVSAPIKHWDTSCD